MSQAGIGFFVKLRVRPECVDEWLAALDELLRQMSKEPSFVSCHLDRDAAEPCLFTLYERWREPSVEAFLANQSTPYRARYDALLPRLLQGPREAQVLLPLRAWAQPGNATAA